MNRNLLFFYCIVCILGLIFFGWFIAKRQSRLREAQMNLELGMELPKLAISPEQTQNSLQNLQATDSASPTVTGRPDPFLKLPVEMENEREGNPVNMSMNTDPEDKKGYHVRAILVGPYPMAYVEEQGVYRKVVVGDYFSGGRITKITGNSVVVRRSNSEESIRLGE